MAETTSTTTTTTVETYLAMWNEPDPSARADLIAAAWTDDGRLRYIAGFFGDPTPA